MRRIVLAVLALTVLLPSLAQARARWLTDGDVYVRDTCCCPPKKLQAPAPLPTLEKVCCKLDKRAAMALPLTSESPAPLAIAALATPIEIVAVIPLVREVVIAIVPRAQAPPTSTLLAQSRGLLL